MIIYNYSKKTGEFIRETEARLDPLEAEKGNEVYLIPSCATTKPPPEVKEHEKQVFTNGTWQIVSDWRGTVFYIGSEIKMIKHLGDEPPAGTTLDPPPPNMVRPFYDGYKWTDLPIPTAPATTPSQLDEVLNQLAKATDFNELMNIIQTLNGAKAK